MWSAFRPSTLRTPLFSRLYVSLDTLRPTNLLCMHERLKLHCWPRPLTEPRRVSEANLPRGESCGVVGCRMMWWELCVFSTQQFRMTCPQTVWTTWNNRPLAKSRGTYYTIWIRRCSRLLWLSAQQLHPPYPECCMVYLPSLLSRLHYCSTKAQKRGQTEFKELCMNDWTTERGLKYQLLFISHLVDWCT